MDQGACPIEQPAESAQLRRQAAWVHVKSFATAALITGVLMAL
jgi:hypothetical protein